ncbi:MAG: CDP-diacylglycerol---glycerol-3-phosphate 3-phosphatidyltransferase [Actinomycetota bacterium]|jgi:CDP-diacylglycerol--glycerol-3-phosphate 3-phosphatidyltransferase|nr:CDP-diacylglycerol---glycerol-3-phosphate 3-phosphatidyltransferase [Actinomycetota bacterium]
MAKTRDLREREVPKVRDMPAPRKSDGAAGGAMRQIFKWPFRAALAFLLWTGIRPWHLTLLSLILNVAVGRLIITGDWALAGVLLTIAGLCDVFDGAIARHRGVVRRSGAFLDSVVDRLSDMILFASLFWVMAARHEALSAGLALVTLVVSLSVSQVRAEAEAVGLTLTEGFFQRLERFLALMIGLLVPHTMFTVLVALAVLGSLTLLQRSFLALRGTTL